VTSPGNAWQIPLRLATGAFILDSGLGKRNPDPEKAAGVHGFAAGTYPFLAKVDPMTFTRLLSAGEIALGTALLLPVVPAGVAGLGVTAFGAGLVGLYLRTPGMRQPGSLRPTEQGLGLAKDTWLLAIGVALVVGDRAERHR
jgi:hypothetical protein